MQNTGYRMWYAVIVRILRRRVVLAIIFCLSLTYCLVNLFGNDGQHSRGADVIVYTRTYPLIWRDNPQDNATLSRPDKCRNSIQGKILIVDDEGYVCTRSNLLSNGCCRLNEQSVQYDCDTCNDKGCCSDYERCVSCCLNPDKKPELEKVLDKASGRQAALFSTVADQFELCLAKCRTDSNSVRHENTYKDPSFRYCYVYIDAHQ